MLSLDTVYETWHGPSPLDATLIMTDFLHQPPSDLDPLDVTVTSQRHSDITSVPGVISRFPKGGSPQVGGVLGN